MMRPRGSLSALHYRWLSWLNRLVCRVMYRVTAVHPRPLPAEGAAIVVCNHSSLGDPLVLLAGSGRPISFLMAREIYASPFQWVYEAFDAIPVRRGEQDIMAIRGMLQRLRDGRVVGLFPEGGLDNFRDDDGRPGIGYLALKTGVPVVPASVMWAAERSVTSILKTLFVPCRAEVRYGAPLTFPKHRKPDRAMIGEVTSQVMHAIHELSDDIAGCRSL